jgi:cholesterol transport system auxiliary component
MTEQPYRWNRRRFAGALAAVGLGACTAIQPPRVETPNQHVLAAAPLPKAARPLRDIVVEVAAPRAWPGFDTREIVYVREPYELDFFAASRWADTPARMLGPLLARALEDTGSFRAVVALPSMVPADVRVDTEIQRLQQSFAVKPSRVELTLRVQLTDLRGRRVLATRVFDEVEASASEDATGGVAAANVALQRALAAIADFCIAATGTR